MIAGQARLALAVAALLVACEAPGASMSETPAATVAASGPTATPSSPSGVTPVATPSPITPLPLGADVRVRVEGVVLGVAADAGALAVVVRTNLDRYELVVADLASGTTTVVREVAGSSLELGAIRDGLITFVETSPAPAGTEPNQVRWRVFAGPWREPSKIRVLDEMISPPLQGGDSWNPSPRPDTNGWEVAWQHPSSDAATEVRLRVADGTIHTAFRSARPVSFALGRYGDLAVAEIALASQFGPVGLFLVSNGTARTVATRAPELGGLVAWQAGRIAWTVRLGLVRHSTEVELIVPATGATETVSAPTGCGLGGTTIAFVLFWCGDHAAARVGTSLREFGAGNMRAFPRALARPDPLTIVDWIVTPVLVDEPRTGTPPRF